MATLTSALATDFTPIVGDFIVQAWGGSVTVTRRNTSGAKNVPVGTLLNEAKIISNPIAGAIYRFETSDPTAAVQADQ